MPIIKLTKDLDKIEDILRKLDFSEFNKANIIDIGGSWRTRYDVMRLLEIANIDMLDLMERDEATKYIHHMSLLRNYFQGDCELEETFSRFKDKEYDFVITSHTLEDIPENSVLLKEMIRIGKRGINLFPYKYYEFRIHASLVKQDKGIYEFDFSNFTSRENNLPVNFKLYNKRNIQEFFPVFTVNTYHHHWIMDFDKYPFTDEIILNCYKKPKFPFINEIPRDLGLSMMSGIFEDDAGFYWEDDFKFNNFNYSYENTMSLPLIERMKYAKKYHNFLFERLKGNYDIKFKNDIL
jgi:hypothetical protein